MASHRKATPTRSHPLDRFVVLDRLVVGPVRLEPERLVMPYEVVRGGKSESTELIYRFQEAVFEPSAAEDLNLAAMIGSQLALNYGAFARELVFRGNFDANDRRFLSDMAENTAREIVVHKLLQPNEFLEPELQGLPVEPREHYCVAELRFEAQEGGPLAPWSVDRGRVCVLSSGGKESLLGFGVLRELGQEAHPIFVNESGRHWFTALSAYREFERTVEHTARVWTNCDRVFAWMLRQLPFIREDFQSLRADEYPVRLWTVAVFLFGVLPLLRKRGIGRVVIGDEYDTSQRSTWEGIPHYHGLYDQSRWFDRALSRYYQRKQWGVSQFSILRPLSELLVETVLAQRYPELLALQVSCHAASSSEERVRPCGRCEKCRRVVAMLRAIGADPSICGYDEEQQAQILSRLGERGVHQERAGTAHLAWLLAERGLLEQKRLGSVPAQAHPEVVKLRFHPERSRIDDVPQELRSPLYSLLLQHAEGAVERHGRTWVDVDILASPELAAPFAFEGATGAAPPPPGALAEDTVLLLPEEVQRRASQRRALWGELSWPEAKKRLREIDVALLPVGAIEQHGHHLPLDVDSFDADYLAKAVAAACADPPPLVLPLVPYGVSYHHDSFAGTISVSNESLSRLCYEIGMAVARNGINKLVIINGHGGNQATLQFAAQMINRDAHIFTCVDTGETSDSDIDRLTTTPNDVHAGEIETSTTMALRPEQVRMNRLKASIPRFSSEYLDFTSERSIGWYARTEKISSEGVFGDPTQASREKGEEMWRIMIHHLVQLVEHLQRLTLDQIYERHF